jgi:hypothetical protein
MKQVSQEKTKPTSKFDLEYELQKNKNKIKVDKSTWKKRKIIEEERAKKVQKTESSKNPSSSIEINSEDEDEFLLNSTLQQELSDEEEVLQSPSLLNPATILALEQARNAKKLIEMREKRTKPLF